MRTFLALLLVVGIALALHRAALQGAFSDELRNEAAKLASYFRPRSATTLQPPTAPDFGPAPGGAAHRAQALPQPASFGIGEMIFQSPIALQRAVVESAKRPEFVNSERLAGKTEAYGVKITRYELAHGRDPSLLTREAEAAVQQLLGKDVEVVSRKGPTPVLVAGERGELLELGMRDRVSAFTVKRLTLPRHRNVYVIGVMTSSQASDQTVFERIVQSVRFVR